MIRYLLSAASDITHDETSRTMDDYYQHKERKVFSKHTTKIREYKHYGSNIYQKTISPILRMDTTDTYYLKLTGGKKICETQAYECTERHYKDSDPNRLVSSVYFDAKKYYDNWRILPLLKKWPII